MQPWEGEALCSRKLRTEVRGKPSSDVTQKTGLLPEVLGLSGREVRIDFWVPSRITDLHMVKDKQILCHGAGESQYYQSMRMGNERPPLKDKASKNSGILGNMGNFLFCDRRRKKICLPVCQRETDVVRKEGGGAEVGG